MKKFFKLLLLSSPIITLGIIFLIAFIYRNFIQVYIPNCIFYTFTGLKCPGCGATRSFYALLSGNLIDSLKLNIIIVFGALLLIIFYIEKIYSVFIYKIKIIPRNSKFWFTVLGMFIAYWILRNFLPI